MKCPECEKEGKTSKVFPGGTIVTDVYYPPFYDEAGNYHHHDGNDRSTSCRCSNGHQWVHSSVARCRCGWPDKVAP